MAEQLVFEELLRQSRAIDRDERFQAAWTPTMNGTGHDFLSRTGFTEQEDGHVGLRRLLGDLEFAAIWRAPRGGRTDIDFLR